MITSRAHKPKNSCVVITNKREANRLPLQTASLFLCLALVVPAFVLAQPATEASDSATTTDGSTSTSTPETVDESWFKKDRISGNVIDSGDFIVGPGKLEVEVKPGESVTRFVTVTNRISHDRTFELFVEDIAGARDGGSVELLGAERGPYSLRDYISFAGTRVELDLGERAKIPVVITVPPDAEPGGYYGSVIVTTVQQPGESAEAAAGARQPIIARIGTLFFVTVPGVVERGGQLSDFSLIGAPWWYEKGPIKFGTTFENTGSIHLNPYGELRITNMFGEEVGYQELDPWFVLPKALRTRDITWNREFLLGRYVAKVSVNRGYDNIVDEREVVFWVLPWRIVGGVFLVVFIILFGLRTFFRTFEFKRKGG